MLITDPDPCALSSVRSQTLATSVLSAPGADGRQGALRVLAGGWLPAEERRHSAFPPRIVVGGSLAMGGSGSNFASNVLVSHDAC